MRRSSGRRATMFAGSQRQGKTLQWIGLNAPTLPASPTADLTQGVWNYDFSAMSPQPTTPSRGGIVTVRRIVGEIFIYAAMGDQELGSIINDSVTGFCIFLARRGFDDTLAVNNATQMLPFMEQTAQDDSRILFQRRFAVGTISAGGVNSQAMGITAITNAAGGGPHFDVRVKRRYDSSQYQLFTGFAFAGVATQFLVSLHARLLYTADGHVG